MGIIILMVVAAFIAGVIAAIIFSAVRIKFVGQDLDSTIYEINQSIESAQGFDFAFLISRLERLSTKAQATFAYQYIHMLSPNKKMLGTVRRYLDNIERETGKPIKAQGKTL